MNFGALLRRPRRDALQHQPGDPRQPADRADVRRLLRRPATRPGRQLDALLPQRRALQRPADLGLHRDGPAPDAGQRVVAQLARAAAAGAVRRLPTTDPDFSWQGQWPMPGSWQTYTDPQSGQAFPVWEGHYVYPGTDLTFIPTFAGGMFEGLMANEVVPETSWGPHSFGLADVRTVDGADQVRHRAAALARSGACRRPARRRHRRLRRLRRRGPDVPVLRCRARRSHPNLGLSQCHGCATEDVVTPHASFLALDAAPQAGVRQHPDAAHGSTRAFTARGGFFDAVNPTTGSVGHRYLVLDQSMIMAALDNALNDRAMQRHFASDPGVLGGSHLPRHRGQCGLVGAAAAGNKGQLQGGHGETFPASRTDRCVGRGPRCLAGQRVTLAASTASSTASSPPARQPVEARVERPAGEDDARGEAAADAAALRRPDHRRRRGKGVGGVFSLTDPEKINHLPARRGRAVAAAHPDPVRLRHHPRLPDDVPGPARRGEQLRPGGRQGRCRDRRAESATTGIKQVYSPMVDVSHDPRWGRIVEGAGEDPYLGSVMAAARVRGDQGNDYSAPDKVVASVKHFAAYGQPEGGRDYNTTDMSSSGCATCTCRRSRPRSTPVPPPRCARSTRSTACPAAPTSRPRPTSSRSEWGFDGFIESDYTAVAETARLPAGEPEHRPVRPRRRR